MDSQDYLEIEIAVSSEETAEIIEAVIGDLGFDSFLYEGPSVKCYIQACLFDEAALCEALENLRENMGEALEYDINEMEAQNWNAEWEKNGFTPIVIDDTVTIKPFGSHSDTPISIGLDPQMAFGTGHHHTTYMMMQTMLELRGEIEGSSVMDLGCGTAVLAILAAKLGAAEVHGIDIDAVAARSAEENAHLNGCSFPILCGDANDLQEDAYDVLLANIHRNIIINDLHLYGKAVRKGGHLLLSGFYSSDVPDIVAAAAEHGFALVSAKEKEDWNCLNMKRV